MIQRRILALTAALCLSACSEPKSQLNVTPLTLEEAQADFDQMIRAVKEFYGPYEYKEARFNYSIDELAQKYRASLTNVKGDNQVYGVFANFLSELRDGHVGISFYNYNHEIIQYRVEMFIVPVLDKADGVYKTYVGKMGDSFEGSGVELWDELVSVDGKATMDYLPIVRKYDTIGYEGSDRHLIYRVLVRDAYMTELVPKQNRVNLVFKKADGSIRTVDAVWQVERDRDLDHVNSNPLGQWQWAGMDKFNKEASATISEMSEVKPFYLNNGLVEHFDLQSVVPNQAMLEKYGFAKDAKLPEVFAGLYTYKDKRVLLVRNRRYYHEKEFEGVSNEDHMNYYRALLDQYDSLVDVLVVDQTHNGGGSYCESFYTLFVQEEKNGFVQKCNADRRWIRTFDEWVQSGGFVSADEELKASWLENAAQIEETIEKGEKLSAALPIISYKKSRPDAQYTWKKPFLVLVDELAGSCGDAYPMLIKYNNTAKLFGHRTMGLGGNVESVAELNISGANVRLTRGLFTVNDPENIYPTERFIENNGVEVDYKYDHSIEDVRNGFVEYFEKFSDAALEQIPK